VNIVEVCFSVAARDFGGAYFIGTIPTELGQLTALTTLFDVETIFEILY
jgi:hypothetical protein